MLYYFNDKEGNPIYIIGDNMIGRPISLLEHDTGTIAPNNGTYFPEVRECPLCKGTGLIKVGKNPVGYVDG